MAEHDALNPQAHLLRLIRDEHLEMPGLRLTCRQAQRLWGLDERTCHQLLASLMTDGFLRQTANGTYARVGDSIIVVCHR